MPLCHSEITFAAHCLLRRRVRDAVKTALGQMPSQFLEALIVAERVQHRTANWDDFGRRSHERRNTSLLADVLPRILELLFSVLEPAKLVLFAQLVAVVFEPATAGPLRLLSFRLRRLGLTGALGRRSRATSTKGFATFRLSLAAFVALKKFGLPCGDL